MPIAGDEYGPDPEMIEEGETTRTKIIKAFGEPGAETADGRFVLYEYGGHGGLRIGWILWGGG